jgi:hypothetical protein
MALFRKRLEIDQMQDAVISILDSRLDAFCDNIVRQFSDKFGIDIENKYLNQSFFVLRNLWLISALKLATIKHGKKGRDLAQLILNNLKKDPMIAIGIERVDEILGSTSIDGNIFHAITWKIVTGLFSEYHEKFSMDFSDWDGKCVISGVEMASCMRAIDFILKDYKI